MTTAELLPAAREVVRLYQGYDPNPDAKAALAELAAAVQLASADDEARRVAAAIGSAYSLDPAKGEVTLTLEGQTQTVKLGSPFWQRLVAWANAAAGGQG